METMQVSHFKTTIAAQLRRVQQGESLVITDHNRPVALVTPVSHALIDHAATTAFRAVPVVLRDGFTGNAEELLNDERGSL
jgi:prevent-host-death family protein